MTCEYCTGTHDLNDNPDFGPCVCCTPQALRDAEEMHADAEKDVTRLQEECDKLEALRDKLVVEHDEALDKLADIADEAQERDDAWQVLTGYLHSLGLGTLTVRYDNPHLDALVEALRP